MINDLYKLKLQAATKDFVVQLFIDKARFDLQTDASLETVTNHLAEHLYFFTAHMRHVGQGPDFMKQSHAMDSIGKYYWNLIHGLIDKPRRNPNLQPLTYAAYDVEGSRRNNPARDAQIPHLHGIILLHPKTRNDFVRMLQEGALTKSWDGSIEDVKFERHRGEIDDLDNIVKYVIKHSVRLTDINTNYQTWKIMPEFSPAAYPFYKKVANCQNVASKAG